MNQEIMFTDPVLSFVNIFMIVGIVLALFAAAKIKKGNQELHAKNHAARRKGLHG